MVYQRKITLHLAVFSKAIKEVGSTQGVTWKLFWCSDQFWSLIAGAWPSLPWLHGCFPRASLQGKVKADPSLSPYLLFWQGFFLCISVSLPPFLFVLKRRLHGNRMLEAGKLAQAAGYLVPAGCSLPADKVFLLKSSKKNQKATEWQLNLVHKPPQFL